MYQYRIKELCIKLVIEASLYYDARSEKHQITSHCSYNSNRILIQQQGICHKFVSLVSHFSPHFLARRRGAMSALQRTD
jgi:hypothetical protein